MVRTTKKKDKMVKLDKIEQKIVKELIRNARASDSEISKKTSIPVMTVNRRRKKLEDEKVLRYYTSLDKGEFGMEIFGAKKLFFKCSIVSTV